MTKPIPKLIPLIMAVNIIGSKIPTIFDYLLVSTFFCSYYKFYCSSVQKRIIKNESISMVARTITEKIIDLLLSTVEILRLYQ